MDRIKQITFMEKMIIWGFLLCCIIVFLFDWLAFTTLYPNITPRVFYIDTDLNIPLTVKGQLMLFSTILSIIGLIGYIWITIKIAQIRKRKEEKYISTLLLSSIIFLGFARAVEGIYIPISSDFVGYAFLGQFYMTFDSLGFSLFMIFVVQVFLAELIEKKPNLPKQVFTIGFIPIVTITLGILSYVFLAQANPARLLDLANPDNPVSDMVTVLIGVFFLFFIILTGIASTIIVKIISLRQRVNEHQKELSMIAVQVLVLLLATLALIFATYFSLVANDFITGYAIRAVKFGLHFINIYLMYAAFVKPAKN